MSITSASSNNSSLADGIADVLNQNRMNGPVPFQREKVGNPSSEGEMLNMLTQNRMNGPVIALRVPQSETVAGTPPAPGTSATAFSPTTQAPGTLAGNGGASVHDPINDTLRQQQVQYGTPTDPHDPKYRMGIGQRILGTLANFASGFAGKSGAPLYVGPGALNNRYYQDERLRQQNLENVDRQLGERRTDQIHNRLDTYPPEGETPQPQPGNSGADPKNHSGMSVPSIFQTPRPTRARETFASFRRGTRSVPDYQHTAYNPETNQRAGSNDGQSWEIISGQDQTRSV